MTNAQATKKGKAHLACRWTEDEDGVWHSDCGHAFVLNDGTPSENGMRWCSYCGAKLKQRTFKDNR